MSHSADSSSSAGAVGERPWWMTLFAALCSILVHVPRDLLFAESGGRGWTIGLPQAVAIAAVGILLLRARLGGA